MNERQSQLLHYIVDGYVATAQPIGSQFIAKEYDLDLSPATIRNEMAQLEEEGFIAQPHTSAGRIPTIKGLEYYLEHLVTTGTLTAKELRHLEDIFSHDGIKGLAKEVAAQSQSAAIIARGDTDYYYTGFSYLFSRPECADQSLVQAIMAAVDRLDTVLPQFILDKPGTSPRIYIGEHNPLGNSCTAMFVGNAGTILFGLLSPVRTNYPKHIALLRTIAHYL